MGSLAKQNDLAYQVAEAYYKAALDKSFQNWPLSSFVWENVI